MYYPMPHPDPVQREYEAIEDIIREYEEEVGRPATFAERSQIAEEYYHG